MAQKYIQGIENHNKLSKFTYDKYEKVRPSLWADSDASYLYLILCVFS